MPEPVDGATAEPGGLDVHLVARATELRCGYCAAELGPVRWHACACGATFHRDCWAALERWRDARVRAPADA